MRQINIIRQLQFLRQLNDSSPVVDELKDITRALLTPENVFVHITANAKRIVKTSNANVSQLATLFNSSSDIDLKMLSQRFKSKNLNRDIMKDKNMRIRHVIFSAKGTPVGYLLQTVTLINDIRKEGESHFEVGYLKNTMRYNLMIQVDQVVEDTLNLISSYVKDLALKNHKLSIDLNYVKWRKRLTLRLSGKHLQSPLL